MSSLATIRLWQRIYENCHLLGMPLKFRYRRRSLIGPRNLGGLLLRQQCTGKVPHSRPSYALFWGDSRYHASLVRLSRAVHAAIIPSPPAPVDLASLRAERTYSADPGGVGADRGVPAEQR